MDKPYEDEDIIYLGKGKFILKSFKNIWFNPDGSEIKPLRYNPVLKAKLGKYTCKDCVLRTDSPTCPVCSRKLPRTPEL
jgi:hypothetical protein